MRFSGAVVLNPFSGRGGCRVEPHVKRGEEESGATEVFLVKMRSCLVSVTCLGFFYFSYIRFSLSYGIIA